MTQMFLGSYNNWQLLGEVGSSGSKNYLIGGSTLIEDKLVTIVLLKDNATFSILFLPLHEII